MGFGSPDSPTGNEFLFPQSTNEEEEDDVRSDSPIGNEFLFPQSTNEEEDDLRSEASSLWSPSEGSAQSPRSLNEEDLGPHLSATKEGPDVAIPLECFFPPNIWDGDVLKQTVESMVDRWLATVAIAHSSDASSSSSSPVPYEYAYGSASANNENNDQHLQPIPFDILDDYEGVDFIDGISLAWFDRMIRQLQSVNPQTLYQTFKENSATLGSYLYDHFASAGLSMDKWTSMNASEFTYQSANDCVMILNISTRLLLSMRNNLAKAECKSFDQDLRDHYFGLCARRVEEDLFKGADSISNKEWPSSHIYEMLILYKAVADVLRDLKHLKYPSESDRIFQQMKEKFKGIFTAIKTTIYDKLNGPQDTIVNDVHPATDFLVRSMRLFISHNSTVQDICIDNRSSPLDRLLFEVIIYLEGHLERHFMSDTEGSKCKYILLLKNLTHIDEETKISRYIVSASRLNRLIAMHSGMYLKECWGPVRDHVQLISGVKPHRSSLDAFTSAFNIVYKHQNKWELQPQLKRKLRKEIENFLVPYYDTFLEELKNKPSWNVVVWKHRQAKHKATEELQGNVQGMFETEHNE